MDGVRHLYVHLPFCAHRCGYCDFVTVVGQAEHHDRYVSALLAEIELERHRLSARLETVYLGGGTPSLLGPAALERLLAALPGADELTIEANPETVTAELAGLLAGSGVNRVSLGAQSFQEPLLGVLERRATPDVVRRAFTTLRDAGLDNLSLDLIYGIPGQSVAQLEADLRLAVGLGPEHVSCYELEAKPGTRFTHAHGAELERQSEAMEGYFELVVETLTGAGYHWYETANFCRPRRESRHNLAIWLGREYVGLGIGAVSTAGGERWRNRPRLPAYLGALEHGDRPPREIEPLPAAVRARELLMLELRLDRAVDLRGHAEAVDPTGVSRMEALGLLERDGDLVRLTRRGRLLGGGVTVEILTEIPA